MTTVTDKLYRSFFCAIKEKDKNGLWDTHKCLDRPKKLLYNVLPELFGVLLLFVDALDIIL